MTSSELELRLNSPRQQKLDHTFNALQSQADFARYEQDLAKPRAPKKSNAQKQREYRARKKQQNSAIPKQLVVIQSQPSTVTEPSRTNHSLTTLQPLRYCILTPYDIWSIYRHLQRYRYRAAEGDTTGTVTSAFDLVKNCLDRYKPFFPDEPADQPFPFTTISIVYPGSNFTEDFPMCLPRRKLDYNPVTDFQETLKTLYSTIEVDDIEERKHNLESLDLAIERRNRLPLLEASRFICIKLSSSKLLASTNDLYKQVVRQAYDRCVKPSLSKIKAYKSFSNEVYGELLPELVEEIVYSQCALDSSSIVVDLGCGVGNIISQISVMKGCFAYGIEIRASTAEVARNLVQESSSRSRLWGITTGEMIVDQGDLRSHPYTRDLLHKADLIVQTAYLSSTCLTVACADNFYDSKPRNLQSFMWNN
ncbi:Nucleosomal histone H3-Lys79 methylase [Stygiomarasmius scandens]|uniref:Histone-lysine N-methyltransferase, H3 lysine-79 specific n=1 Tax=Marasmiellus scandens TaxID=2682957 RepID=A0ABR1INN3_9AGAR